LQDFTGQPCAKAGRHERRPQVYFGFREARRCKRDEAQRCFTVGSRGRAAGILPRAWEQRWRKPSKTLCARRGKAYDAPRDLARIGVYSVGGGGGGGADIRLISSPTPQGEGLLPKSLNSRYPLVWSNRKRAISHPQAYLFHPKIIPPATRLSKKSSPPTSRLSADFRPGSTPCFGPCTLVSRISRMFDHRFLQSSAVLAPPLFLVTPRRTPSPECSITAAGPAAASRARPGCVTPPTPLVSDTQLNPRHEDFIVPSSGSSMNT